MLSDDINSKLREMSVNVDSGLPPTVSNSIYYAKIKHLLFAEIVNFCREKVELKSDLQALREHVGEPVTELEIREYLDQLKEKYNNRTETNIGIDYHIEFTRIDIGVAVFAVIKRDQISMKQFIFRFRKSAQDTTSGLSSVGLPLPENEDDNVDFINSTIAAIKGRMKNA